MNPQMTLVERKLAERDRNFIEGLIFGKKKSWSIDLYYAFAKCSVSKWITPSAIRVHKYDRRERNATAGVS